MLTGSISVVGTHSERPTVLSAVYSAHPPTIVVTHYLPCAQAEGGVLIIDK